MSNCSHPRMSEYSGARFDYCPDCGYEFYYGDAHAKGEASVSRLVNPGSDGHVSDDRYYHVPDRSEDYE